MNDHQRFALHFGPYHFPPFNYDDVVMDEVRGEVTVVKLSDAKIPWPIGKLRRAKSLIVIGGLADAIRRESNQAVCYWWGITPQTVTKWQLRQRSQPYAHALRRHARESDGRGGHLCPGGGHSDSARMHCPDSPDRSPFDRPNEGKPMPILFYSKSPDYGWLSNFSEHGFTLNGIHWPSVEHFYQAQKYTGSEAAERIRQADSPLKAKKAGQDQSLSPRPDWDEIKEEVMRLAIRAKFEQNRRLLELLLGTGNEELIHESRSDLFWGRNHDGTGENRLGAIIMEVRQTEQDR